MKTHITLKKLRDSHLRAAARGVMRRSPASIPIPVDRLVQLTLREKAPGYYVSLEHAECMLRLRRSGRLPASMTALKRLMWDEIAGKVDRLMAGRRMTITDAISRVLCSSEASRFFISEATARRLLMGG
ncbi:MAG: hypothetical protein K2L49_00425 [Muribaculaceae bacterium]|nr:hypothetical protein [Muribaculaceae bacterium]